MILDTDIWNPSEIMWIPNSRNLIHLFQLATHYIFVDSLVCYTHIETLRNMALRTLTYHEAISFSVDAH